MEALKDPVGAELSVSNRSYRTVRFHLWMILVAAVVIYYFREFGWLMALMYLGQTIYFFCFGDGFDRTIPSDPMIRRPGCLRDELRYLAEVFRTQYAWRIERDWCSLSSCPEPSHPRLQKARGSTPTDLASQVAGDHPCDEEGVARVSREEALRFE
jgi:hypothetical protein